MTRLGDGWLVSQATPAEVRKGIGRIREIAEGHGREIEDDQYGALFSYYIADRPEQAHAMAEGHPLRH